MLIPIGLIVVVCLADVLAPADIHLGPLLVSAPAITAAFAGPGPTAAIGTLAVAAQVGIGIARHSLFTANLYAQIGSLIVVAALLFVFTVVRERYERQLFKTRSVAAVAQQVLLRPLPERSADLEIASIYLPAEEEAEMGGDLFAAARTAQSTRLVIGDVRGKGLPAYSQAALLLGAFRAAAHRQATLPNLARHLDGAVRWDNSQWRHANPRPRRTAPADGDPTRATHRAAPAPVHAPDAEETFATVSFFDIPDRLHELGTISCGHPPALLLRDGRAIALHVEHTGLPIGLGGLPGAPDYVVETFPFEPGDLLLLYTDGVTEARDGDGTFYPLAERAGAWSSGSPRQVLRRLREDLLKHTNGRLTDDAAAVAVLRSPAPPPRTGHHHRHADRG
ncbi:hypothetical protein GCM10010211_70030 [Streptomyces albospinus]|uniref:PPM-type phosphatase domain-containing protein n=1 Tax=Streptomyces albospinus TaxID=285515 RepID=A0ABQ2VK87_9ACTN|nr:PP2C family protein-serine/threonine phosphatase [Streptomyces albospinus]GGU93214.1 hypothetical protein GCM10010211_70030 [Streptomyces albospinus]